MALRSNAAALGALLLVGCFGTAREVSYEDLESGYSPDREPLALADGWTVDRAFEGEARINGVACGDLTPELAGDEIVSVDAEGLVRLIERRGGHFFEDEGLRSAEERTGAATNGELVQVACGDLDPGIAGDEVLAVGVDRGGEDDGGAGVLRYYARSGPDGTWQRTSVVLDALAHAVAIGDLQPDRAGLEFVVAGFFGEALLGHADADTGAVFLDSIGARHDGNAKGVALVEGGFVLACDDGNTVRFERDASSGLWKRTEIKQHGAPLARIARYGARDFVLCDDDGILRLYGDLGTGLPKVTFELMRSESRLRGAVVADVDPGAEGVEACTAGYDGHISVVQLRPAEPTDGLPNLQTRRVDVARETGKLHHLALGTFDGLGRALVASGYPGDVLVVTARGAAGEDAAR